MTPPNYQDQGAVESTVGSGTPAWPTHITNDVAIMMVASANQVISLTTAEGFVEILQLGQGTAAATNASRLALYWCRATSAAMAGPTIADAGNHTISKIITFRGCILTGDPWDIVASDNQVSDSATVTVPGGTTTIDDCLICSFFTTHNDGSNAFTGSEANADLTDVQSRVDSGGNAGNGSSIGLITGIKAVAGTFGATTATLTVATRQSRIMIALKPEPPSFGYPFKRKDHLYLPAY